MKALRTCTNKAVKSKFSKLQYIQSRSSTAFDPYFFLHSDTVSKEQAESFRKVWDNDIGSFKNYLTKEELDLFEDKVTKTASFWEFYGKMQELWGPRRHHAIRQTRSWNIAHNAVNKYHNDNNSNNEGLISIIWDTDEEYKNKFSSKYLYPSDTDGLLEWFTVADVRYMTTLQAIDIYGGPKLSAVFGCRNNYHYAIPDPNGHSAHWLGCLYDRINLHDLILCTAISAIKENKEINQLYFRDKLESLENNAMKDEEWKEHAQQFMYLDTDGFNDKLDRAFLAFQTDEGVTELLPRFDSDE